jgi:hypothetical protein
MNNQNQDNADVTPRKGTRGDQTDTEREHETHTTALIMLSLAALVVVVVALSMAQPHEPPTQENTPETDAVAKIQASTPAQPGREVSRALRVFPQELPAPHAAELVSSANTENGSMAQHIVRLETDQPLSTLFDQYNRWAQNSGFQVTDANQNGSNAAIALARPDSQLFITMVDLQGSRRVEFNQVQK